MKNEKALDVNIMGCEFRISCPDEEREEILLAVAYLDKKMQEIKHEGKIIGSERIAIVAALNIAHELLMLRDGRGFDMDEFRRRIGCIQEKLDDVLIEADKKDD